MYQPNPIFDQLPISVVRRTDRPDGLTSLQFSFAGLVPAIGSSRKVVMRGEANVLGDLDTYVAFALVQAILAPLRRLYPKTFLLSRLGVTVGGIEYGGNLTAIGIYHLVPLLEGLPHRGLPVLYRTDGGTDESWGTRPPTYSLLADLSGYDPGYLLPLLVEETSQRATALLFLPEGWDLSRVGSVATQATSQETFEASVLAGGGGIYCWKWMPEFDLIVRPKDVVGMGYDRLPEGTLDVWAVENRTDPGARHTCYYCGEVLPSSRAITDHH